MTSWPSNTSQDVSDEEKFLKRTKLIANWLNAKTAAKAAVAEEMVLRTNVKTELFPTAHKGTQRFPLPNGYAVKLVQQYTYPLGLEVYDGNGEKVDAATQVEFVLDQIDKLGPEATRLASKIIKWKPELSYSNYKELDVSDPLEMQVKKLIDSVLTVKESAPALEFEEPKQR